MRFYVPSRLDLRQADRSIQLQFTGLGFDMCLFEAGKLQCKPHPISAAQLRQVAIDMRPVDTGPFRFVYEGRNVVIEFNGRLWARVPDIDLMRLLELATQGTGTPVDS